MRFGRSNNDVSLLTIDVLGHEYMHGVTQSATVGGNGLEYHGESGALNESISDIFGTALERHILPNDWNWLIAEELGANRHFRDMAMPGSIPNQPSLARVTQPDRYNGPNWANTCGSCGDFGGVHTNSGVMNRWFNMLCTGFNNPNNTIKVNAIDFNQALAIVYKALNTYVQQYSNYADMRNSTIYAARDLYGDCSMQMRQVQNAWFHVDNNPWSFCPVDCNYTINTNVSNSNPACSAPIVFAATCVGSGCYDIDYNWSSGASSIGNGQSITVNAPSSSGSYTYTMYPTKSGCNFSYNDLSVSTSCGGSGSGCVVNKVRLQFRFPTDCCFDRLVGAKIQGSNNGGGSWTDLHTIGQNGTGAWQEFSFSNATAYTSVRFQASNNGWGELAEIEFYNGNTKLSGTPFGNGNFNLAYDNNTATKWETGNMGTSNVTGLNLTGCSGGCTPPNAPSLSASPSTISSGNNSTLTASGCSGTVSWSTGATGNQTNVSPTQTTTYTATCTENSCISSSASVTVTVNGGSSGCVVNKVRLKFRSDCCFDRLNGAQIQGTNDGSNWATIYTINQNGTGNWQEFTFSNSTTYKHVRFVAGPNGFGELFEIEFYNGNSKLTGGGFGNGAQDPGSSWENAIDGNEGTFWHGPWNPNWMPGPSNFVGIICAPFRIGVAGAKDDILIEEQSPLQLYPNPTDGHITVRYQLAKGEAATLRFVTVSGQVLEQKALVGEGGWQQHTTDLSAKPDGIYTVLLETQTKATSRKFVIAK